MAADDQGTEQEAIAGLSHTEVPGRPGFSFMGPPAKNGDVFDIEIIQDSRNASIGTARGATKAEVIAHAQELAEEFTED